MKRHSAVKGDHWLKNGTDVSWEHIIDVLKSDIVGERELAAKLELEFVKSLRANPSRLMHILALMYDLSYEHAGLDQVNFIHE